MKKFRGQILINFSYSEHLGPRFDGAGVSLRMTTHDSYEFVNAADWSEYDFGYAVENGIRNGLTEIEIDPDLGVRIVLEKVEYDPVDSSEHSFYVAAKSAVMARAVISHRN
ncbi:hypothetical protein BH20ACI4_BH20ACI4_30420 [soil metagenome]